MSSTSSRYSRYSRKVMFQREGSPRIKGKKEISDLNLNLNLNSNLNSEITRDYEYEIRREMSHVNGYKELKYQANKLSKVCKQNIMASTNEMKKFKCNKCNKFSKLDKSNKLDKCNKFNEQMPSFKFNKQRSLTKLKCFQHSNEFTNFLSNINNITSIKTPLHLDLERNDKIQSVRSQSNLRNVLLVYNNSNEKIPGLYTIQQKSRIKKFYQDSNLNSNSNPNLNLNLNLNLNGRTNFMPNSNLINNKVNQRILFPSSQKDSQDSQNSHPLRSKSLSKFKYFNHGFTFKRFNNIVNTKLFTPLKGSQNNLFPSLQFRDLHSERNDNLEMKEQSNSPFQRTFNNNIRTNQKYNEKGDLFNFNQHSLSQTKTKDIKYLKHQTDELLKFPLKTKNFSSYLPTQKLLNCIKKYKLPSIGFVSNSFKSPQSLFSSHQL